MNPFIFVGVGFSVLVAIINVTVLCAIKFNDLSHFSKDLEELKKDTRHIYDKVNGLCQRVSVIEGKLDIK